MSGASRSAATWRAEVAALQDLGRSGAAFDHALRCIEEGRPSARWFGAKWLAELGAGLLPVQLNAFRQEGLDKHCGGLRPAPSLRSRGRAWFPAVYQGSLGALPEGFAPGALGQVLASRGREAVRGDLSEGGRAAAGAVLALLRRRGLLPFPVQITVRAPREVVQNSLQLAVAAAVLTLVKQLQPLDDVAFTGALGGDGTVLPVGSVEAKRRLLDEEWPGSILLVPPENEGHPGCFAVGDLSDLIDQLAGRPATGWDQEENPEAVRRFIQRLRDEGHYVWASRIAWAASRSRSLDFSTAASMAQLVAQLDEANNTGAQARALRLAETLEPLFTSDGRSVSVALRGEVLSVLSRHDSSLFRLRRALERAEEALQLPLEPLERVRRLRACARARAENLDLDGAVRDAEESLALALELGQEQLRGLLEAGEWRRRRGELDVAQGYVEGAASQAEKLGDERGRQFVRLLRGRLALGRGAPAAALKAAGAERPRHPSPGIELVELRIRALLESNRRVEAREARRQVDREFYGALRGSTMGRMLALRMDLALAAASGEQALVRGRIWRLPGFEKAYGGRIPDTTAALLSMTPC